MITIITMMRKETELPPRLLLLRRLQNQLRLQLLQLVQLLQLRLLPSCHHGR